MGKYRKRRPEAQIIEPVFGLAYDCGKDVEKAVWVGANGRLESWYRVDFEREYERVEEKVSAPHQKCCAPNKSAGTEYITTELGAVPKPAPLVNLRCAGCGGEFNLPAILFEDMEHVKLFCVDCANAAKVKKSKPRTLADLKPGDVFLWTDYPRLCQKQVLSETHFFLAAPASPLGSRVAARGSISGPVTLLSHHPLTPKQLLWVNATPEERKALEDSIRDKWLPRTRGEARSSGQCALCQTHGAAEGVRPCCGDCVVGKAGERCAQAGSPWRNWRDQTCGMATLDDDWMPESSQDYKMSRRMTLSLSDFLPNIHPLRIEVEATPVEWPGAKK